MPLGLLVCRQVGIYWPIAPRAGCEEKINHSIYLSPILCDLGAHHPTDKNVDHGRGGAVYKVFWRLLRGVHIGYRQASAVVRCLG